MGGGGLVSAGFKGGRTGLGWFQGGKDWFRVVSCGKDWFRWFRLVPLFSNYLLLFGYANGDENVIVDSNKGITEITVHVSRGDIKIWKSQKITNFNLPACVSSAAAIQWSSAKFSIFGYYSTGHS